MKKSEPGDEGLRRLGLWLAQIRNDGGMSQRELAKKLRVSVGTISRYEGGHRAPDVLWLARFCDASGAEMARIGQVLQMAATGEEHITEVAPPYRTGGASDQDLLEELGGRLRKRSETALETGLDPRPIVVWAEDREHLEATEGAEAYVAVPYLEAGAAAASGRVMRDNVARYVLIHERVAPHPELLRCVLVAGQSMARTLPEGSIVAVDTSLNDPREADGRIVCARTAEGEVVIKRWRRTGQHILLYSDNEDQRTFPPIVLEPAVVDAGALIGAVIWAWLDLR